MHTSYPRLRTNVRACVVACVLGVAATGASATPTAWEFRGAISGIDPAWESQFPGQFSVGSPVRVIVSFDTEEPVSGIRADWNDPVTGAVGKRYNYFGSRSVHFAVYAGADCNPCVPSDDPGFDPAGNFIFVRDNYRGQIDPGTPDVTTDGISFGLTTPDAITLGVILRDVYDRFDPPVVAITGTPTVGHPLPLPAEPDARLAQMAVRVFQACLPSSPGVPDSLGGCLQATLDSVDEPAYGTGYLFTARDCRVPQLDASDTQPTDCINAPGTRAQTWSYPRGLTFGGGLGYGDFTRQFAPKDTDIDPTWGTSLHAALGLPQADLGSLFGSVSFSGPVSLPVVKASTFPSDVARTNSNLTAYQKYNYSGAATSLPLVINLTYDLGDYNVAEPGNGTQVGLRPGGASVFAALIVLDGAKIRMDQMATASLQSFGALDCGAEAALGWPAGAILGIAQYSSGEHETGPHAALVPVSSCAVPGQPVQLQAGQDFIVATVLQAPARGKAPQPPSTLAAQNNGYSDAANTLRVKFDPAAPASVIDQLTANIEPACADCDFAPDPLSVLVDVKPGSSDNCINPGSNGVIPVAILGTTDFDVRDVVVGTTLRLGSLGVRVRANGPQCSYQDVNVDGHEDLVCQFVNSADNWQPGQSSVTASGVLRDGTPIAGTDRLCLKP